MKQRVAITRAVARCAKLAGAQALAAVLGLTLLLAVVRAVDHEIAPQETDRAELDGATWSEWLAALEIPRVPGERVVWTPSEPSPVVIPTGETEPISEAQDDPSRFHGVDITGYTSRPEETDDDPFITAMCTTTGPGVIAVSRDLLETFTPGAPFDFGDKVLLPGVGIYRIEDTMHPRWKKRADIWFASLDEARAWGHRRVYMTKVDDSAPLFPLENPVAQNF